MALQPVQVFLHEVDEPLNDIYRAGELFDQLLKGKIYLLVVLAERGHLKEFFLLLPLLELLGNRLEREG